MFDAFVATCTFQYTVNCKEGEELKKFWSNNRSKEKLEDGAKEAQDENLRLLRSLALGP
jgi:hypothetical protein